MTLNLQTPSYFWWKWRLRAAEVEEKYAITGLALKSKYLKCLLVAQQ
jgi:hypothetical protein